jgi:plastocyanin
MGFDIRRDARRAAPAVLLLAAMALPAAADARTKVVEAGPFTAAAREALGQSSADANVFFRRTVTIRRGDRVRWDNNGFHTITFVPRGDDAPGLVAPDAANPVTGVVDAAGAPFWFNGQPRLTFNPLVAFTQGGKRFNRNTLHNSGLPLSEGPPEPYRLRFNRKGTFRYLCIVHPGMKGTVKVVGRGARVPSARKDRRAARREQGAAVRRAARLADGPGALANTIQAGNDDRRGTAILKFFPAAPAFKVGDVVTLRMPRRSPEVHTITFGPNAYLGQLESAFISPDPGSGGPPTIVFEPRGAYPSDNPAAGPAPFNTATHGNGFMNTGVLDSDPATPVPASTQVRFTGAGSYTYICLIHPFMRDTLTVTP